MFSNAEKARQAEGEMMSLGLSSGHLGTPSKIIVMFAACTVHAGRS
jgi:hypothetical protein